MKGISRWQRARRRPVRLAFLAAALLAWSACNLSDPAETRHYIQLQLPDSLRIGDSVQVLLNPSGNQERIDTLWNGPLTSDTNLAKLPAPDYQGGDANLFIAAWHQSRLFYQIRVEYRQGQDKPKVLDILPPDSLPPVLDWKGPDSLDLWERPSDSALAALFPDMACVDDRDRDSSKPSMQVIEDSARVGMDWIGYRCRDRAGNLSAPRFRKLRIQTQVDTEPPQIVFEPNVDSLVSWIGHPIDTGSVSCRDNKDTVPRLRSFGSVDSLTRGGFTYLTYECTDASGHFASRRRLIRVIREPDSVKPVITRRGPDTLVAYDGEEVKDTAVVACVDVRDGRLDIQATSEYVHELGGRGYYPYYYECRDSAGNSAKLKLTLRVIRRPDHVPPLLSLRGPDSLLVYDGDAYVDSGAACVDERDGKMPVETHNPVDTRKRGEYVVTYACADSDGNAASATRRVHVGRKPDAVAPVLLLKGSDTVLVYDHDVYRDSGAVCIDARDGQLPVDVQGTIDTGTRGLQSLAFSCADSVGNASRIERMVRVARRPDGVKPVLSLRGPDSIQVWQNSAYADSGVDCVDDRDGPLQAKVAGSINTASRGLQILSFQCTDSSGNQASIIRKVLVIRVPDLVKPVLTLRGPDSLQVLQGDPFVDNGADCVDDRDGRLLIYVAGSINTSLRGPQTLSYECVDSAGNQSSIIRKVLVVRVPDLVKPVLTLRGPDSLRVVQGAAYADSGASCVDDRDGILPVATQGSVNTAVPGAYVLTFTCSDSAANAAIAKRTVTVPAIDTIPPVISMAGPDTMLVVSWAGFVDPGSYCRDDKDGVLTVTRSLDRPIAEAGFYLVSYSCRDNAGNTAVKIRTLKLGTVGINLPNIADSQIDTLNDWANNGAAGGSGFVEPNGRYFGIVRFDLSKVRKAGLKSAKLRYYTFLYGMPNVAGFRKYTFEVWRVKSDWVEGTGDWFFHDGGYKNGGEVWYQYYPVSAYKQGYVTNPAVTSGVTGASLAMVRDSAMVKVATQSDSLYYGPWCGNPNQLPAPDHLTPVELDITDYVMSADPANDFGFIVKVFGLPSGMIFAYLNKDASDLFGTSLVLQY